MTIEVGDETIAVHATELTSAERDEKYRVQSERYPGFAAYQQKTSRTIPVIALTRRGAPAPDAGAPVSRRVQFDHYGPEDVLHVVDVPRPSVSDGHVLIRVATAGINPGEIAIRNGAMEQMFPATFPSGQGSDFAGRVVEVGPGVTELVPGDEVMCWSDRRSAQADYVVPDRQHLTAKPRALDWIRAGALWAIGVTSFSAVHAGLPLVQYMAS